VVITFWPHPRWVVNKSEAGKLKLLNTLEEKQKLFIDIGIDHLVIIPFNEHFAQITSDEFIKNVLLERFNVCHLIIGSDHQFGKGREGTQEIIKKYAREEGFSVELLELNTEEATKISSTKIRNALINGNVKLANDYLGYNYFLQGLVVTGKKLGNKIGFPTANINIVDEYKLIPKEGVYAVEVEIENNKYRGMLNIGLCPTVNSTDCNNKTVEVHIFNFSGNIYLKRIKAKFIDWIREEKKFGSLQELKNQLEKDEVAAKNILA
jgi:riboflavin kinase/FMN adenylyltransferase